SLDRGPPRGILHRDPAGPRVLRRPRRHRGLRPGPSLRPPLPRRADRCGDGADRQLRSSRNGSTEAGLPPDGRLHGVLGDPPMSSGDPATVVFGATGYLGSLATATLLAEESCRLILPVRGQRSREQVLRPILAECEAAGRWIEAADLNRLEVMDLPD